MNVYDDECVCHRSCNLRVLMSRGSYCQPLGHIGIGKDMYTFSNSPSVNILCRQEKIP